MSRDERYLRMALELAAKGLGSVEPNPAVGAVIVRAGKVIGRGWHKKFGGPHAEINALADCKKRRANPKGATMFVTLEPCCHFGKTGPCTDALIAAKLKKVVVATIDPSKHANGKGIRQLRKAGIKVVVGECQAEARLLNAPFMKFASTGKTWVTLKWAQSIDSKLAWAKTDSRHRWISCEESRKDAHNLRRQVGAILVGINTVLKDDPLLTPRPTLDKKPLRIVLDNHLRIPLNCKMLKTAKDVPMLIVTRTASLRTKAKKARQIAGRGATIIACPASRSNLKFLLAELGKRGVHHLLVEGGPVVIGSFLKARLADEVVIYVSPKILDAKGSADISPATNNLQLCRAEIKHIREDIRITGMTEIGIEEISETNLKKRVRN
ncbi:MAG: bifunctional diaminohydroxyphosphoribosylaminopyrimidine deaminase/5-amino-6-(5-phosphoribosylamino)uracil reductase RibD [Sedimentisphaerales bacterium]